MRILIAILFTVTMILSCQEPEVVVIPPPVHIERANIKLESLGGLVIGNSLTVTVITQKKKSNPINLVVSNDLVSYAIDILSDKRVELDGQYFIHSGLYTIAAIHNDSIIAKRSVTIEPGPMKGPLDVYTGPASIVTGSKQSSMIVTVPSDSLGNGFVRSTGVVYEKLAADQRSKWRPVKNLHSVFEFRSGSVAKKTLIGVSKQDVLANEQAVIETPDWPANFSIKVVSHHPFADNRQYLRLQTDKIVDDNGNQIADGTEVAYQVVEDYNVIALYKAITIDGVANVYIRNPSNPASWLIRSYIGFTSVSNGIPIAFKENISDLTIKYDRFTKRLLIGPLKSMLGQYAPDGTIVTLTHNGKEYKEETLLGEATFDLMNMGIEQKGNVLINVSDLEQEITL